MRTTVGPLPSGVYWRRRAVVLGALLLGALILFISCSGGDEPKQGGGAGGTTSGATTPTDHPSSRQPEPEPEPSFAESKPGNGPALPEPGDVAGSPTASQPAGGNTGPDVPVGAPAGDQCGDAEMSVTPVPAGTAVRQGAAVKIRLKIKNISARTCTRDVGADLQEIYLKQGARTVWSSDTCGTAKGTDMAQFPANAEREYEVTWNGRDASKCADGLAVGPVPAVGVYQVFGRLGSKVSVPVTLSVTA